MHVAVPDKEQRMGDSKKRHTRWGKGGRDGGREERREVEEAGRGGTGGGKDEEPHPMRVNSFAEISMRKVTAKVRWCGK